MLVFRNAGEIDIRLITTIGVNVKEGPSPIGYFGTGLKYAIATALRHGFEIEVHSGLARFRFVTEEATIRGKVFQMIKMQGARDAQDLAFTTELGKNWKPWMIYRELWSNATDEPPEGDVLVEELPDDEAPKSKAGVTQVLLKGMDEIHAARGDFILLTSPLQTIDGKLEVHAGPGLRLFYRGIAVRELDKAALFTYNILEEMQLTEDRTASSWADVLISKNLSKAKDEGLLRKVLSPPQTSFERRLDWDWSWCDGEDFLRTGRKLVEESALLVNDSLRKKLGVREEGKHCPTCGQVLPLEPQF